jgi:hypothetical protein
MCQMVDVPAVGIDLFGVDLRALYVNRGSTGNPKPVRPDGRRELILTPRVFGGRPGATHYRRNLLN